MKSLSKILRESIRKVLLESIFNHNMVFISYGTDKFDPNKLKPINYKTLRTTFFNKPIGGLWASPLDSDNGWADWCYEKQYNIKNLGKHFIFKLKPNAKIYVIDNLKDLQKYGTLVGEEFFKLIDYQKLLDENYDGIYVTSHALRILSDYVVGRDIKGLEGWDVDSICVFNANVIEPIEEDAFEKASRHNYAKPKEMTFDDWRWGDISQKEREQLQMDSDFEKYSNQNIGDTSKLFKGEHPAISAQRHGNDKRAKLARKFNGTIKSGMKNK